MTLLYLDVEIFFRETLDYSYLKLLFAYLEQAARLTGGRLRIRLHDELVGDEHAAAALGGTCPLRAPRLGNSA